MTQTEKMVVWRKFLIKLINLYSINIFQRKFSCFVILYLLIIFIYLNQSDLINFNLVLNSPILKCFWSSVIFIFLNVFNGLKSGLQVGLFLKLNTAVRSKSTLNSCNTEYLVRFKLLNSIKTKVFKYEYNILEYY